MNKIKKLTTLAVTTATLLAALPASAAPAVQVFTCNHKPHNQFSSATYWFGGRASNKVELTCNYNNGVSSLFKFEAERNHWQHVGKNWQEDGFNTGVCRSTDPTECVLALGLPRYSQVLTCNHKPLDKFISSEYTVGGKNNDEVDFKCYYNNNLGFKTKLNVPFQNWEIVGKNWKKVGDNRGTCQSSDSNECALIVK